MNNKHNDHLTSKQRELSNDALAVYEDALIRNYVEYTHNLRAYDELQALSDTLDTVANCNYQINDDSILDLAPQINTILESYNDPDDPDNSNNNYGYRYLSKNKIALAELKKKLDEIYSTANTASLNDDSLTDITDDELFNIPADMHLSIAKAAEVARINANLAEVAEIAVQEALKYTNALRKQPHYTSKDANKNATAFHKAKLQQYVDKAIKCVNESEKFRDEYFNGYYND